MRQEHRCNVCNETFSFDEYDSWMTTTPDGKVPSKVIEHTREEYHQKRKAELDEKLHLKTIAVKNTEFCENDGDVVETNNPSVLQFWLNSLKE